MINIYDPIQLRNYVYGSNNVLCKESNIHRGLYVLKYRRNVFYDNLWDDVLKECRGLVIDGDYRVVVHPFTKVYNRGENGTDFGRDEHVRYVKKINGFMAARTWHPEYGVIISTTGSLDSEHAMMARKMLEPTSDIFLKDCEVRYKSGECPHRTEIYEICHPDDPHIIPEVMGAYLIGARDLSNRKMWSEEALDGLAKYYNRYDVPQIYRPQWSVGRFSDVVDEVKNVRHEGFMVYTLDGRCLKLKSPFYKISKLFARKNNVAALVNDNAKQNFDEEYYPLIDKIKENLVEFTEMEEQQRLEFIRDFIYATV
ncbi:metallophosphoesterase [Ralstonia phage RSP15]|uniref:metallophosphoesterase n=1 Tax=Ralstonia phage RSP15 TaxID=1785960 RepID=UPI00074D32A9|nr:metallophosphoesterase [Ralstonia phage RSP15]BAU40055.1 metallophosphoesterase [Ralstonia phage RSP15]